MSEQWVGKELRIERDLDLKNFRSMITCPLCNKVHIIDDPQEISKESLYCDTHKKRVPFPEDKVDKLKRLSTIKYDDLTPEEKASAHRDSKGLVIWTF